MANVQVLCVHPGGGRKTLTATVDGTQCHVTWGSVGGVYRVVMSGKRKGQLIGASGWELSSDSFDEVAKLATRATG